MFHCAQGHLSEPGEMRIPVVSEVRPVAYRTVKTVRDRKENEEKEVVVASSHGTEVVEELAYCPRHASEAIEWFNPPNQAEKTKEVVIAL